MKVTSTIKSVNVTSDVPMSGAYLEGNDYLMLIVTDNKESKMAQKLYQTLNMVSAMYGAHVHLLEGAKHGKKRRRISK